MTESFKTYGKLLVALNRALRVPLKLLDSCSCCLPRGS